MVENSSFVYFVLLHKIDDLRSKQQRIIISNYRADDREFLLTYYGNRIKEIERFILNHFPNADLGDFRFSE